MNFDWRAFLVSHRIEFTEKGHSKGNVGITCPWCGDADHGFKLGIHLAGKGWHCWRDRIHSGVRPHRLIQALLKCSYFEAQRIVGDQSPVVLGDLPFVAQVNLVLSGQQDKQPYNPELRFPTEFYELGFAEGGASREFLLKYLNKRGYIDHDIWNVVNNYWLHGAFKGPFAYRLIFPIEMYEGVVCWTGRTISPSTEPRYKTLTSHIEKQIPGYPIAIRSIKDCLWNLKSIVEDPGDTLVLCEGPFDAMRVDYYGYEKGIRATCIFGKSITDEQLYLLEDIMPIYKDRILLLDQDAELDMLATIDRLRFIGFVPLKLPPQFKDPAQLSKKEVHSLFGY